MKKIKQPIFIIIFIVAIILVSLLVKQFGMPNESEYQIIEPIALHTNGQYFVGSESCKECHPKIYEEHVKTAHFNSSAVSNGDNIKGSLEGGNNYHQLNKVALFAMTEKEDGFYQDFFTLPDSVLITSKRFDVTIGSGTKGQTYLNWREDELYQLQISYYEPTHSWINSPGYSDKFLSSNRPIQKRCLECHATYAENTTSFNKRNEYVKSQMVYGIDCERCHGPAMEHVKLHRENPEESNSLGIQSYANLSRQQKLDACALCHSGARVQTSSPFSFIVGDTLTNHSVPDYDEESLASLDVHGNQYGLISASQCFIKSETMDCATCHNPHKKERGNTALFNSKCIGCHTMGENVECTVDMTNSLVLANNCIQCHMPLTPSESMKVNLLNDSVATPVMVRSHFIGIYDEASK